MALCTQADVERRIQWDITAEPDTVVTTLIAAAQALIEGEIGRKIESAAYTETLDGPGDTLFLSNWPVTAITSVEEDGTALTASDYLFSAAGQLLRVSSGYRAKWTIRKPQSVEVAYTAGYSPGDTAFDHSKNVCAEVVARAFRQGAASAAMPPGAGMGGVTGVTLAGSDSVTYATASGETFELGGGLTRFVFLLPDEQRQVRRYRSPAVA